MGVFDYLRCDYKPKARGKEFQTKDTPAQGLEKYVITRDGHFYLKDVFLGEFTGEIRFYDDDCEYSAYLEQGKVVRFNSI
jgi:hypothetical protein